MGVLVKAAGVCLVAAVFSLVVKKESPAIAVVLSCAAGCVVIALVSGGIGETVNFVTEAAEEISGLSSPVLAAMLKAVATAMVTRLASDMCKDAGLGAAASAMELAGSVTVFAVALPVLRTMLSMIRGLI